MHNIQVHTHTYENVCLTWDCPGPGPGGCRARDQTRLDLGPLGPGLEPGLGLGPCTGCAIMYVYYNTGICIYICICILCIIPYLSVRAFAPYVCFCPMCVCACVCLCSSSCQTYFVSSSRLRYVVCLCCITVCSGY